MPRIEFSRWGRSERNALIRSSSGRSVRSNRYWRRWCPRARAHGGDRQGALEDLRQMVIDRVLEKRPSHRVVGAERREPLAGSHRKPGGAAAVAKDVGSEHQLVQVGVRMAAVDEPFTPVPG